MVEHTFGDLDFTVYAVPFVYHAGPWKLFVAPGIEDSDLETTELVRLGVTREFEVGSWAIAPQLAYDLVNGENAVVLGVEFGKGF